MKPVNDGVGLKPKIEAYDRARRPRLETHPNTGAAQLVDLRKTVPAPKPALFANMRQADLLACGVPREWVAEVRNAAEDSLLLLANHLPAEAAEALLDLATGAKPNCRRCRAGPIRSRTPMRSGASG